MTRSLEPITSWTTSGLFYKNYFSLPKISTQSTEGFGIGKGRFIHSKLNKRTLISVAYGRRYRVGLGRILISIRISGIRPDIWLKPDVRHYKKNQPDIRYPDSFTYLENGRISGQTGYPAQP